MSWLRMPLDRNLGAYRADWDALNDRYYGGHPFLDSRFVEALLKYFGTGREQLFIHRTEGAVDGLLILRAHRLGIWRQFVPDQLQSAPILVPRTELLGGLFKTLPLIAWSIEFMSQDPEFTPPGLLDDAPDNLVLPHALTMNVSLDGDFNSYWRDRSTNLQKNIRRYLRRAEDELGSADYQEVVEPAFMAGGVTRFGELESKGWKGIEGTAVNINNTQGLFYIELMSSFAMTGQAQVLEYKLGERLVASRMVISRGGISVILKTSYDETFSRFAPGRLLLHAYLESAFKEKRHKAVEFYTNATQDQLAWATGQRVISHVTCFRRPWLAAVYKTYQGLKASATADLSSTDKTDALTVDVYDQISALPKACKALFDSAEQDGFDLGSDWFELLVGTAIPANASAHFYVLSQGTQIRCVMPLLLRTHGISALTTFYSSLYRPLIADGVQSDELAVLLRRVLSDTKTSSIRFDAMDPTHPSYTSLLAALRQVGLRSSTFFAFGNWYQTVSGRSFEAYFNSLSSQIRNTVKRRGKKFLASGGRLEIVTGGEGLESAIQAWDRIYRSSWKASEPYPEFVPGLIHLCARKGWLRLGVAYYNNVPIAAQIWIVSHGRAAIYKLAYDESYAQHSTGTLLTAHLMRYVMDADKVGEVDYLIGDDTYKKNWMDQRRERWGIVAYNLLSVYGMGGYGIHILGRLWHRLKKGLSRALNLERTKKTTGEQNIKWKVYPAGDVERFSSGWDDLNNSGAGSHLLTSQYLLAALHAFGTGREILACLGEPQTPDCMVVLVKRRGGVWETFQPAQAPLGFWVMRNGMDLESMLSTLIRSLPGFPLMLGITQQDPLLLPRSASSAHLQTLDYFDTARILVESKFESFWENRGKNLRQNMRKARNRLKKAGLAVQLVCVTDPVAVKQAIANYGQLESAGWKAKYGTAVHSENEQGRFYQELLETHCMDGTGRIYQLMFNDRIAAMDLCVHRDGVIVILKTTYNEAAAKYSPAMLMHQELFQALFESGEFQRIEFYGKVMDWHLCWTEDKRTMYHINYYRWAWLKRLLTPAGKAPEKPVQQAG